MLRVLVDQDKCCGAGSCVRTAPEIFAQRDEDGLVVVLTPHPPTSLHELLNEAVDICPVGVISVDEVSEEVISADVVPERAVPEHSNNGR